MVQYSSLGLEDGGQMGAGGLYGQNRSSSSASSTSPPASGQTGMLVVPQPINASSKMSNGQHQHNGNGMPNGNNQHNPLGHVPPLPHPLPAGGGGGGRKYQCKMCPQIFGSKADLQLHTQVHMREAKPYKCTQCNKSFANSSYLSQHTRIHLGIKPYRCEICQRKFTQLSHLQQHIRTHTGDKPYRCRHPGCTKAFSQLSNLQSHSRCHQTDKPYKCNSCYKCFVDETALLDHIPKHKESKHLKTHICQFCGKSYTQETYLAKHMQKHSDRPNDKGGNNNNNNRNGGNNGQAANNNNNIGSNGHHEATSPSAMANTASHQAAAAHMAAVMSQNPNLEAYWPKMDPYAGHHDRTVSDYAQYTRDIHQLQQENVANHQQAMAAAASMTATAAAADQSAYGDRLKTSNSAFSPIQTGMLNTAAGGFGVPQRNYFYDTLGFSKHHSQMGFDGKTGSSAAVSNFPNQLISLSQIKNYAHQPTSADAILHSMKEKAGQIGQ